jgi:hypothetical protein
MKFFTITGLSVRLLRIICTISTFWLVASPLSAQSAESRIIRYYLPESTPCGASPAVGVLSATLAGNCSYLENAPESQFRGSAIWKFDTEAITGYTSKAVTDWVVERPDNSNLSPITNLWVSWTDRVTIAPAIGARAAQSIVFNGFISGVFNTSLNGEVGFFFRSAGELGALGVGSFTPGNVIFFGDLVVPFAALSTDYELELQTDLLTQTTFSYGGEQGGRWDWASVFNAGIIQARVLDADGQDITDEYTIIGASGRNYRDAIEPVQVPEPTSAVLIASAFGVALALRRYRSTR